MGNQNGDTVRQITCPLCKRSNYHFKFCPIVIWKQNNKGKMFEQSPFVSLGKDIYIMRSRNMEFWEDPILSKQWGTLQDLEYSAEIEALFFTEQLT